MKLLKKRNILLQIELSPMCLHLAGKCFRTYFWLALLFCQSLGYIAKCNQITTDSSQSQKNIDFDLEFEGQLKLTFLFSNMPKKVDLI